MHSVTKRLASKARSPLVCGGAALLVATTLLAGACGGAGARSGGAQDASVVEAGSDALAPIEASDALDGGAAGPDAFAQGTHLVPRPSRFEGLTSDGYVVFSESTDAGGRVAEVIGLDGGGAATIVTGTGASDSALLVQVSGPVVFAWTDRGGGEATLTLWSSAAGVVPKGSGIRPGRGAASNDGAYVAYVTHATTSVANVVMGPIGSSAPATVGAIDVTDTPCWQDVDMAFVSGAAPRFLSFFCPNGSAAFTVRSVDVTDGGAIDLSTVAVAETFGKSVVLVEDATGKLTSTTGDGSGPVTLASNAQSFTLSEDEQSVVVQTMDDRIIVTPAAFATPRVVVPAGMGAQLGALSPDGAYVLFASTTADGGADQVALYTDVQLAALASGDDAGATIRPLVPSPTSCPSCLNDSFTPDSTHAMALDPIDNSQAAGGTGPVHVFPLDGGADWRVGTSVATVIALDGGIGAASRFLFVGATADPTVENGFAYELYVRSIAATDTANEVARDVEWLGIDDTRTTVVYSLPGSGELAGVWAAPLQ